MSRRPFTQTGHSKQATRHGKGCCCRWCRDVRRDRRALAILEDLAAAERRADDTSTKEETS